LRRALGAFRSEAMSREEALRWLALAVLPIALGSRTAAHVFAGELAAAASLAEEQAAVLKAIGSERAPYAGLVLAAWQGRKPRPRG